jgi:hypothetical protein
MEVEVVSDDHREGIFVEIGYRNVIWAQICYDGASEQYLLSVGTHPKVPRTFTLPLDEMVEALKQAKEVLISEGYGPTTPTKT